MGGHTISTKDVMMTINVVIDIKIKKETENENEKEKEILKKTKIDTKIARGTIINKTTDMTEGAKNEEDIIGIKIVGTEKQKEAGAVVGTKNSMIIDQYSYSTILNIGDTYLLRMTC